MNTSTTIIIVEILITTVNNKTLEPIRIISNENEVLLKLVNWIVLGTIMTKD